jgi:hypothetical protein
MSNNNEFTPPEAPLYQEEENEGKLTQAQMQDMLGAHTTLENQDTPEDTPVSPTPTPTKKPSSSEEKKKKMAVIISLIILIAIYLFFIMGGEEDKFTPQAQNNPPATNQPEAPATSVVTTTIPQQQRIASYDSNISNRRVEKTLKQINESEKIISVISQMKKDLQGLRSQVDVLNTSGKALEKSQERVYQSLRELHTHTSSSKYILEDGSKLTKMNNGYEKISSSGIKDEIKDGTFIAMKNGALIRTQTSSSLIFVFFSDIKTKQQVSNIYKITPSYGLVDLTDTDEKDNIKKILSSKDQDYIKEFKITEIKNMILFFNNQGELSTSKKFIPSKKNYSPIKVIESSIRNVLEFETTNFTSYKFDESGIYIDGRPGSILGYAQDFTFRLADYRDTTIPTDIKEIGRLDLSIDGVIIKSFPSTEISTVILRKSKIKNDTFVSKEGLIYKVNSFADKVLMGPGKIVATIINGKIASEKILLTDEAIKYSSLRELSGMTLVGKSGMLYVVDQTSVTTMPAMKTSSMDDFLISSSGELTNENKNFIDEIISFESTKKSGALVKTTNKLIKIQSHDLVQIKDRNSTKYKDIKSPKVVFTVDGYIKISIAPNIKINEDLKTINGNKFIAKEKDTSGNYRYVLESGEYFRKNDPVIDLSPVQFLNEKILDIELIKGSVFDYNYKINEEEGLVSNDVIGKFLLSSQKSKFKIFQHNKKTSQIEEKKAKRVKKSILTLEELLTSNESVKNLIFESVSREKIKIVTPNSIMLNGSIFGVTHGKYNTKRDILTVGVDRTKISNRAILKLIGNKIRLEFPIKQILYSDKNYYTSEEMVVTTKDGKVMRFTNPRSEIVWTKIYSESVDIRNNTLKIKIKPQGNSALTFEEREIPINNILSMSPTMIKDVELQYTKYTTDVKKGVVSKEQKQAESNTKILESRLSGISHDISLILGTSLEVASLSLSAQEIKAHKETKQELESVFSFEIGMEFSYKIENVIEVSQGETAYTFTNLEQNYFEDREGNTISMGNPIIVLKVDGDFNTNKVVLSPVQLVYTNELSKRIVIDIPDDATKMQYEEEDSDFILSGVPAYYVNQKIKELPTTVMLSTLKGVMESMTAPKDGLSGALEGMGAIAGGEEASDTNSFTEGVTAGAAGGIDEILAVYKAKSEGKTDLLITPPNFEAKSIFVKTFKPGASQ